MARRCVCLLPPSDGFNCTHELLTSRPALQLNRSPFRFMFPLKHLAAAPLLLGPLAFKWTKTKSIHWLSNGSLRERHEHEHIGSPSRDMFDIWPARQSGFAKSICATLGPCKSRAAEQAVLYVSQSVFSEAINHGRKSFSVQFALTGFSGGPRAQQWRGVAIGRHAPIETLLLDRPVDSSWSLKLAGWLALIVSAIDLAHSLP